MQSYEQQLKFWLCIPALGMLLVLGEGRLLMPEELVPGVHILQLCVLGCLTNVSQVQFLFDNKNLNSAGTSSSQAPQKCW